MRRALGSKYAWLLLCGGLVALAAMGLRYRYVEHIQEPQFKVEFIRTPDGATQGAAKATALNASARSWLRKLQASSAPPSAWFTVEWEEHDLTFSDLSPREPVMRGTYQFEGDALHFNPAQPVTENGVLSATLAFAADTQTHGFGITESTKTPGPRPNDPIARWFPRTGTVPANALKFYLAFSQAMTQGEIYQHIRLETQVGAGWKVVDGAFREAEMWTPPADRLTVWLHPGRQKSGVNLNETEGPVLTPDHTYRLILDHQATTATGTRLKEDAIMIFTASAPDHACPDPRLWKVTEPRRLDALTFSDLHLAFNKPMDWAMLRQPLTIDGTEYGTRVDADGRGLRLKRGMTWSPGVHAIEPNPLLEDMAGNNLTQPFEVDVAKPQSAKTTQPARITFEVKS